MSEANKGRRKRKPLRVRVRHAIKPLRRVLRPRTRYRALIARNGGSAPRRHDAGASQLYGLDWRELAKDRQLHRLKRGKHFRGDTRDLSREAAGAAADMELAVRILRDEFFKQGYFWVQFVDHEIPVGAPCPSCGARELDRIHQQYGRCPTCEQTFAFVIPKK